MSDNGEITEAIDEYNKTVNVRRKFNINNEEDLEKIKQILNKYARIYPEHYKYLQNGISIAYINKEGFFIKDTVIIKNKLDERKLFIKKNFIRLFWSLKYDNVAIYALNDFNRKVEKKKKENLYKLYEAGMVKIVGMD
jgi:hypothetical protein